MNRKSHHKKGRPPPAERAAEWSATAKSFENTEKSLVSMSTQTLAGVAVKTTDAVDAKKEYALVEIGGGGEVTPVTPE